MTSNASAPHAPAAEGVPAHGSEREQLVVFAALVVMLLVEIAVARTPGIGHGAKVLALLSLAVAKAVLIGFYFMHLKYETKILRFTVLGPLAAPPVYALVLMADAAWRFLR